MKTKTISIALAITLGLILALPIVTRSARAAERSKQESICEATNGNCYYVSMTGDDSAAGSFEYPWKSIEPACYQLEPGDILYIRGGVYTGEDNIGIDFKYHSKHATPDDPIIIKAYPGEQAVIDAEQNGRVFEIQNVDWMVIDSIEFRNSPHSHIRLGWDVEANNITIKNCRFSGIDYWIGNNPAAIYVAPSTNDLSIHDCSFIGDGTDTTGHGVIMFGVGGMIRVFNNEFRGVQSGVLVKHRNDEGSVTRVYNNYVRDTIGVGIFLNTDDGIIENNLIVNSSSYGIKIFEGMGHNAGDNNFISHNTIANCHGGIKLQRPMDGDPGATNTRVFDNIIYESAVTCEFSNLIIWAYATSNEHNTTSDYNCYYDSDRTELIREINSCYTLEEWQFHSCSSYACQDEHSIQDNPQFINSSGNLSVIDDFRLAPDSPGKESASDGTDMGMNMNPVGIHITDLRVAHAITDTDTLTATLRWTAPTDAVTYTLRYSNTLISEDNWAIAVTVSVPFTATPGGTEWLTAPVAYAGSTVYFALKSQNAQSEWSSLSNNAFWPRVDVYLPLVMRES